MAILDQSEDESNITNTNILHFLKQKSHDQLTKHNCNEPHRRLWHYLGLKQATTSTSKSTNENCPGVQV